MATIRRWNKFPSNISFKQLFTSIDWMSHYSLIHRACDLLGLSSSVGLYGCFLATPTHEVDETSVANSKYWIGNQNGSSVIYIRLYFDVFSYWFSRLILEHLSCYCFSGIKVENKTLLYFRFQGQKWLQ